MSASRASPRTSIQSCVAPGLNQALLIIRPKPRTVSHSTFQAVSITPLGGKVCSTTWEFAAGNTGVLTSSWRGSGSLGLPKTPAINHTSAGNAKPAKTATLRNIDVPPDNEGWENLTW